jgi:flagellin-specific chaperone FliS
MPRLTVEFPEKAHEIIERLSQRQGVSKTEVLRRVLALYNYVWQEVEKGRKLVILNESEEVIKEIVWYNS